MSQTQDISLQVNTQERVVLLRILEHYLDGMREERRRTEDPDFREELKNELQMIQQLAEKIRHATETLR